MLGSCSINYADKEEQFVLPLSLSLSLAPRGRMGQTSSFRAGAQHTAEEAPRRPPPGDQAIGEWTQGEADTNGEDR